MNSLQTGVDYRPKTKCPSTRSLCHQLPPHCRRRCLTPTGSQRCLRTPADTFPKEGRLTRGSSTHFPGYLASQTAECRTFEVACIGKRSVPRTYRCRSASCGRKTSTNCEQKRSFSAPAALLCRRTDHLMNRDA